MIDRMKKILGVLTGAIITLLLFQNCQKSDFLVITGVVRDSITNQPIEGAYIITENGNYYRSASDGTFSIDGIQPGKTDFVAVAFNGYYQKSKSILISDGRVNKIDFNLHPYSKPEIETGIVTNTSLHSATVSGSIKLKSQIYIQRYGHCWSNTNSLPTLEESIGSTTNWNGSWEVNFTSNLMGLQSDIIYYVRAYAVTDAGIIYGNSIAFRTGFLEVSNGLLAYFPFTYDYSDQSGNGSNTNGWSLGLTNDRFGNSSNALSFTSSSFFYSYSYTGLYSLFQEFSISFWFYKSSWSGNNTSLICTGYPSYTNEIRIAEDASSNKLYFDIVTGSGTKYKVSAISAPALNMWHHVVAQRNNTAIEFYIDGVLQGSVNCDNQPINNDMWGWGYAYLFSGRDLFSDNDYFKGSIDDIRVYNRALSSSEIQYLKAH